MEMVTRVASVMDRKSSPKPTVAQPTTQDRPPMPESPPSSASPPSEEDEPYTVRQAKVVSSDGSYRGSSSGGAFLKVLSDRFRPKNPKVVPLIQRLFTNLSRSSDYDLYPVADLTIGSASTPTKRIAFYEAQSTLSFLNQLYLPPMVVTDRLVSTFFSEWHPLFPVLDHCEFLSDYRLFNELMAASSVDKTPATFRRHEQVYTSKMSTDIKYFATTLLLVCSLAAHFIAGQVCDTVNISELERNWRSLLEMPHVILPSASTTSSTRLLAAYNLALTYSLHVNAIDDVWKYRSLVAASCHRMGLNRSQEGLKHEGGHRMSLYDQEIRQRLFWVSFIQDTFVASFMGTNQSFVLEEVQCGLPSVDDEGLQHLRDENSVPPAGGSQGCFRAMISFSKVLSEVITALYSLSRTQQSYKAIIQLENKLQKWHRELPSDLKFEFANGMPVPTSGSVHQKSPLLYLMYNYAKILIHLPALCGDACSSGTQNAASIAVIQSAKSYVQVSNYLRVRNVLPTLCVNPSGMSAQLLLVILYGSVDYSKGGSLLQEVRQMVPQCIEGLNSDMKLQIPGSVSLDSYDLLDEVSTIILAFPVRKKSVAEIKRRAAVAQRTGVLAPMPVPVKEEDLDLFANVQVKLENSPPDHDSLAQFMCTNSMVTPANSASAPSSTSGEDDFKAPTGYSQASSACGQLEQTSETWEVDDSFKTLMMPNNTNNHCSMRSLSVGNQGMADHYNNVAAELFAPLHPQQLTATGFTDIDKVRPTGEFDWGVNGILDWDWK